MTNESKKFRALFTPQERLKLETAAKHYSELFQGSDTNTEKEWEALYVKILGLNNILR